jgi:hypothetical protein
MGAVAGSEIVDLLIVRSRSLAQVLRLKWGSESPLARDLPKGLETYVKPLIASALAATAMVAAAVE